MITLPPITLYGFDTQDALTIFAAWTVVLAVGMWLLSRLPRLVRYAYGTVGGGLIAAALFAHHDLLAHWWWQPVLVIGWGLVVLAVKRLGDRVQDWWRTRRGRRDARVRALARPATPRQED